MATISTVNPKIKINYVRSMKANIDEVPVKESKSHNVADAKIGFSNICSQIYKNAIRKGFQLNLMITGCSGLGKSSFLNTLFRTNLPENPQMSGVSERLFKLVENDITLTLKIIEFPKFGDDINNTKCWKVVNDYLDKCFESHMKVDYQIDRLTVDDINNLVHICLHFVQPRSDKACFKELDLELMKNIHNKVNIIPIIAKADTMTAKELKKNKSNLMAELADNEINFFKFVMPDRWTSDNEGVKMLDKTFVQSLIDRFPFAIVSGSEAFNDQKEQILVRSYPWGKVEVDNLIYSDTSALRTLILSTHLQELMSYTHDVVYENYRRKTFEDLSYNIGIDPVIEYHPYMYLEKQLKNLNLLHKKKMEEMESEFQVQVDKRQLSLNKRINELEELSELYHKEVGQALCDFDRDLNRFIADKTKWDFDHIEYHEAYGTMRISCNGPLKPLSKVRK